VVARHRFPRGGASCPAARALHPCIACRDPPRRQGTARSGWGICRFFAYQRRDLMGPAVAGRPFRFMSPGRRLRLRPPPLLTTGGHPRPVPRVVTPMQPCWSTKKPALRRAFVEHVRWPLAAPRSLELAFLVDHVLADDGIVLLDLHLARGVLLVLVGGVEVAGAGRRVQADLVALGSHVSILLRSFRRACAGRRGRRRCRSCRWYAGPWWRRAASPSGSRKRPRSGARGGWA